VGLVVVLGDPKENPPAEGAGAGVLAGVFVVVAGAGVLEVVAEPRENTVDGASPVFDSFAVSSEPPKLNPPPVEAAGAGVFAPSVPPPAAKLKPPVEVAGGLVAAAASLSVFPNENPPAVFAESVVTPNEGACLSSAEAAVLPNPKVGLLAAVLSVFVVPKLGATFPSAVLVPPPNPNDGLLAVSLEAAKLNPPDGAGVSLAAGVAVVEPKLNPPAGAAAALSPPKENPPPAGAGAFVASNEKPPAGAGVLLLLLSLVLPKENAMIQYSSYITLQKCYVDAAAGNRNDKNERQAVR
jgi:hypothetical protein